MAAPSRALVRAALAAAIAAGAAFLLLELTARVFLFGWAGLHPWRVDSVKPIWESGFARPAHPRLGFELAPGVDGHFKLARFRTNSQGLRDDEYAPRKPPNTWRVAFIGSSFTAGSGVEIEDVFHSRVERRLNRASRGCSYELVNFGVGAYNARQALAMLELRALAYDPDLLVFAVTRLSAPQLVGRWQSTEGSWQIGPPSHPFFGSFLLKLARVRLGLAGEQPATRVPPRSKGQPDLAGKLARIARAAGIPVAVVRLQFDVRVATGEEREPAWERRIRRLSLPYLDTRPGFAGTRPRDFWIYELDPHPNAAAHAIFAEALATFLRERGLVPDPQFTTCAPPESARPEIARSARGRPPHP